MSCDPPTTKWACEYCTYENWPSSLKCTMCRGSKPLLGEDIYRLCDESPPLSLIAGSGGPNLASGPSQHDTSSSGSNGKWECRACTYLNWSRSSQCTECQTPRPATVTGTNLHEHLQPLRIDQLSDAATLTTASGGPLHITTSPSADKNNFKDAENDLRGRVLEKAVIARQQTVKWMCTVCTYENWPKATKCIMCNTSCANTNAAAAVTKNNAASSLRGQAVSSGSILPSPEREMSLLNSARGGGSQVALVDDNSTVKRYELIIVVDILIYFSPLQVCPVPYSIINFMSVIF